MRLLVHTLLTLMIAGILGGVALHYVDAQREEADRGLAHHEVARFQQEIHLQSALAGEANGYRRPKTIDPAWFEGDIPENPLLGPEHPWLEIAAADLRDALHPPDLTAADPSIAKFWYNPANGIVRARVPLGISDAQVLALYNEINDTNLTSVFPGDVPPPPVSTLGAE